jgi:hypothetical protein
VVYLFLVLRQFGDARGFGLWLGGHNDLC